MSSATLEHDALDVETVDPSEHGSPQKVMRWGDVYAQLEKFRLLEVDWDGLGAYPPNAATLMHFERLINQLRSDRCPGPHFIRVAPDGHICLEWYNGKSLTEADVSETAIDWIWSDEFGFRRHHPEILDSRRSSANTIRG